MEILRTRSLWRPNPWGAIDICEAIILVEPADTAASCDGLSKRLADLLPELRQFAPPAGAAEMPSAFPSLLCRLTLALQAAGRASRAGFQRVVATDETRVFRVGIEAVDRVLAAHCLHQAAAILRDLRDGASPDMAAIRTELVDHADDVCLGPSTMLIVAAAEERGIPWQRLGDQSLVQLGQGRFQRRIWTAETDRTSAIAESISRDKQLTKQLLEAAGVPVPRGRLVSTADEAWLAAREIGLPVVVKPLDGNHGRGVFLNLSTREEIEHAFAVAQDEARSDDRVIVEEFVSGKEHRLLVVASRVVACARAEPLFVTGDGHRTVVELIESQLNSDPRRGRSEAQPNKAIKIDDTVRLQLAQEGAAPESVLPAGQRVLVKRIGSHECDVTDQVHPDIATAAIRAARTVGLDIAGIDVVAQDIGRPMLEQGARVCEVNAGPQLLIHADPGAGTRRQVGHDIVDTLFAPGETGRIPIVAMLGCADEAAVELESILRTAGRTPALTCGRGKWIAGYRCATDDCSSVAAARGVLVAAEIDVAIFALAWRDIACSGSPAERIDVLVIGPLVETEPEASRSDTIDSPRAVVQAMVQAVAPHGTIVLANAPAWVATIAEASGCHVVENGQAATAAASCLA